MMNVGRLFKDLFKLEPLVPASRDRVVFGADGKPFASPPAPPPQPACVRYDFYAARSLAAHYHTVDGRLHAFASATCPVTNATTTTGHQP